MVTLLFASSPAGAPAQALADPGVTREPNVPEKAGKTLIARRVRGEAPRIDGLLNDAAWAQADSLDDLIQWDPDNMAPASERTVVRVLYDDRYLYVGVHLFDRDAAAITAGLGRRDNAPPSDNFAIGFDSRHSHQTGYVFQLNPSGVRHDFEFTDDTRSDLDYNAVWEGRSARVADGWTAEYRIPFSQMRFPTKARAPVWGMGMRRTIHRKGEIAQWVGRPRGQQGQVSRWGHLQFEDALAPPRRIELFPFAVGRRASGIAAASVEYEAQAGADARIGLGTGATLSATLLPDFGQVEADPAVLNLSVFETFFPERRLFFLEDGNTFVPPYGLFRLFHSRRIGRRPGYLGIPAGETVVDRPAETTLLAASKVTGTTAGFSYGVLTAATAAEHALVERAVDGSDEIERSRRLIEPATFYNAARLQRNFRRNSNAGWIATAVLRDGEADAYTTGVDYNLRWRDNRFYWNGHWAASHAPVAGKMTTGLGGVTNLGYSAKHYSWWAHLDHFGRDFNINDLGFLRTRTDRTLVDGGFELSQPDPWLIFRNVSTFVGSGRGWNRNGLVFEHFANAGVNALLRNFWVFNVFSGYSWETLDDLDTRGGPPIVRPAQRAIGTFLASDSRKSWRANLFARRGWDVVGGSSLMMNTELRLSPSARLQATTGLGFSRRNTVAQWIRNFDATGDGTVDHVYGSLDSRVVDITLRGTFAFHPELTLELFVQPFVAVGDYSDFRRLARERSFEFEPVDLSFNPDFNRKSLLGNSVLRWEYRPGSTLFLVWSVVGSDPSRPGVFSLRRDLSDAFSVKRDNVFMLKASYWLSL
ncbi:MAG TPA: DUF5916 domain-containing protein [Gemmatimonadaceae bacterium]|nr:DUF5916 domain-containing protein [Gemmatimonadaceae bacterium]